MPVCSRLPIQTLEVRFTASESVEPCGVEPQSYILHLATFPTERMTEGTVRLMNCLHHLAFRERGNPVSMPSRMRKRRKEQKSF